MRDLLDGADFHSLFLELGWDNPPDTGPVEIEDAGLVARRVAGKKGVAVWLVVCDGPLHGLEKRRVSLALRKHSPLGRLVLVDTPEEVLFLWPEYTPSGRDRILEHIYTKRERERERERLGGTPVLQRLERVQFTLAEQPSLTPLTVRDRVRNSFNVEKVTISFYREFKDHHADLTKCIKGITHANDRRWYASVLLNRLMFIYFIQRKGFMGDDRHYLRNRLTEVQEHFGPEQPYVFFCEFLLPLFHQGLGQPNPHYDDPAIACLIGELPYIDGGIFEVHQLENKYQICIEDAAFMKIFKFFDKWRWYLDESGTGADNEISPYILGFIFEQYVNQKDTGAYYTKPDVTGYMATNAIIPAVVDRLITAGLEDPIILLTGSGAAYIHNSLGYGVDNPLPPGELSSSEIPDASLEIALPGERWCDVLYRHQRYNKLMEYLLDNHRDWTIDEAITHNLDLQTLMVDYLSLLSTPEECQIAFDVLKSLTVCDPTVGSGSFLLAALDVLDPMYTTVIEAARYLELTERVSIPFLTEASAHINERYWMLRTICLNNLYGVDIMAEAVDIAKLRLFLKLAAQTKRNIQVEPLPDLDFNIRTGNLLVGLADLKDASRRFDKNRLPITDLGAAADATDISSTAYREFVESQIAGTGKTDYLTAKQLLENKIRTATDIADSALHKMRNEELHLDDWCKTHQPFHWFAQFPAVWKRDGFDVIIGNPPYINLKGKRKNKLNYNWQGYTTQDCPDLYAVCLERASELLNYNGRLGMIVMHSLCFNDKFRSLRQFLESKFPSLWVSSYANIPEALFSSAWVRNSIIIGNAKGELGTFTTRCRRWTAISRDTMFNGVEYIQPHVSLLTACGKPRWPFIDNQIISDSFAFLLENYSTLSTNLLKRRGDIESSLYYKNVARYIIGIAHTPPPRTKNDQIVSYSYDKVLSFNTKDQRDLAQLILSGRWGYIWWLVNGDEFAVTKGVITSFPAGLTDLEKSPHAPNLFRLAIDLQKELPEHLKWKANAGLEVGRYDLRECSHITDKADWLLAKAWGLTEEQFQVAGNLRERMTFGQKG